MIFKLCALWRWLTTPDNNIWLALLAALVGVLILLGLIDVVAPLLPEG